jgi:hypothetical protein
MLKIDTISRNKKIFNPDNNNIQNNDGIYDLTIASVTYENIPFRAKDGIVVSEELQMRPDLIAKNALGDTSKLGSILKMNNLSNPFAIGEGMIMIIPLDSDIEVSFDAKKEKESNAIGSTNPNVSFRKSQQNKVFEVSNSRKDFILKNGVSEFLPPNMKQPGEASTRREAGLIYFGPDAGGGSNLPSNQ